MQDDNLKNPLDAGGAIGGTAREVAETEWAEGPWVAQRNGWGNVSGRIIDARGFCVAEVHISIDRPFVANAHLIAAATELYEALLALDSADADLCNERPVAGDEWLKKNQAMQKAKAMARAALAKARGER